MKKKNDRENWCSETQYTSIQEVLVSNLSVLPTVLNEDARGFDHFLQRECSVSAFQQLESVRIIPHQAMSHTTALPGKHKSVLYSIYIPLFNGKSLHFPQSICGFYVIPRYIAVMHLNGINRFGFVVENRSVLSEVGPEFVIT